MRHWPCDPTWPGHSLRDTLCTLDTCTREIRLPRSIMSLFRLHISQGRAYIASSRLIVICPLSLQVGTCSRSLEWALRWAHAISLIPIIISHSSCWRALIVESFHANSHYLSCKCLQLNLSIARIMELLRLVDGQGHRCQFAIVLQVVLRIALC